MRRVNHAPQVLLGVWLMTALASLPFAFAMGYSIQQHLGASLESDQVARGVNYDWMQEFNQAAPFGPALRPAVSGFAAVLDNLSAFLDHERPFVGAAAIGYLALWVFVAGGIIDRYARNRPTRAYGFFSTSGVFFFRFLRLMLVEGAVYGLLLGSVHPWLFDTLFDDLTHDVTVERSAFLIRFALYGLFAGTLGACNLVFDYAKVRAVVEDRRSMLGALGAAVRFLRRNAAAAMSLYLVDVLLFVAVLAAYAEIAPDAGSAGWSVWVGFAIGQLYVLGRLWVKLVFWASETALFQGRLAHAGYVAGAEPAWPESPAAEAIGGAFTPPMR